MPTAEKRYDPNSLPDLLPIFYKRLFPYGPYFRWLNYGGVEKNYFLNREFSFTLKDDIYIRYQSFANQDEMEKEIQKRCPYKIDLGAVFSISPKLHQKEAKHFHARERELVFDIDMTDYDDVRNCCSGADICKKCWPLMTIAIKIVDRALREDFGFEHRLWVYSGRRGVHCWVCDEVARKLSQNGRTAIAEYLSVVKGGDNQAKKVSLKSSQMHPHIRHSIIVANRYWEDYAVKEQDFMGTPERVATVLNLIPNNGEFRDQVKGDVETVFKNTRDRWKAIVAHCEKAEQIGGSYEGCSQAADEVMLQYCYPRLDVNVSKGVNHLLKSPFCVHPKTGRVCVPMDPDEAERFDPFSVPTISDLCDELDQLDQEAKEDQSDDGRRRMKDYKNTSLKACLEVFEKFVKNLESSWKGKLLEKSGA